MIQAWFLQAWFPIEGKLFYVQFFFRKSKLGIESVSKSSMKISLQSSSTKLDFQLISSRMHSSWFTQHYHNSLKSSEIMVSFVLSSVSDNHALNINKQQKLHQNAWFSLFNLIIHMKKRWITLNFTDDVQLLIIHSVLFVGLLLPCRRKVKISCAVSLLWNRHPMDFKFV